MKGISISIIIMSFFCFGVFTNNAFASDRLAAEIKQLLSDHIQHRQAKYFNVTAGDLGETDRNIQFKIVGQNALQLFIPVEVTIQKGYFLPLIKYSATKSTDFELKNAITEKITGQLKQKIFQFFKSEGIDIQTLGYDGVDVNSRKIVARLKIMTSIDNLSHQEAARISAAYLISVCKYDEMKDGLGGGVTISPILPSFFLKNYIGIGTPIAERPSHTATHTGHVRGGSADRTKGGPGKNKPNDIK